MVKPLRTASARPIPTGWSHSWATWATWTSTRTTSGSWRVTGSRGRRGFSSTAGWPTTCPSRTACCASGRRTTGCGRSCRSTRRGARAIRWTSTTRPARRRRSCPARVGASSSGIATPSHSARGRTPPTVCWCSSSQRTARPGARRSSRTGARPRRSRSA